MSAKRPEGPQAASEHDDLLMLAGAAEGVEHALNAIIVAIHQRVIEDDRHDLSALGQHGAHGEAHQHGDLLLGTVRKALEQFGAMALDAGDRASARLFGSTMLSNLFKSRRRKMRTR